MTNCSMSSLENLNVSECCEECDDIFLEEENISEDNVANNRRTRAERRKNSFRKKKNRIEMIKTARSALCRYYFDDDHNIIKYPNSSRMTQFFKKVSNRKIRRNNSEFTSKGNTMHKMFDYWWELY